MDKCISSIAGQTYTNLEILLVNDGSTDGTDKICDSWQERDHRIRAIHQQNEGVSCARNNGIKHVDGEYVAFVDADDWIDVNMYSDMMSALLSTGSDIVHCDLCIVYDDGSMEHRVNERDVTVRIMGRAEGVIMILDDHKWRTQIGCKIYKKILFENIEFPKGRIYGEDMIVHDLFHHAAQTVFLDKEYYFYLVRNDSASRQGNTKVEMKKISDYSDANFERYSFVVNHPEYQSVLPFIKHKTINLAVGLMRNMVAYPQYFTKEYIKVKTEQLRSITPSEEYKLQRGINFELNIIKISPQLYKILRLLYVFTIRVTNKLKITNRPVCYSIRDLWWLWHR